jgi:hypothetical protein
VAHFIQATNDAHQQRVRLAERSVRLAAVARRESRDCLADWQAVPEDRRASALRLYVTSVQRPVYLAGRTYLKRWMRRLRDATAIARPSALAAATAALIDEQRYLDARLRPPMRVCEVLRAWRSAGWATGDQRPPVLVRLETLATERRRRTNSDRRALLKAARLLQRLGGASGASAARNLRPGIDLPDGVVTCDPAFTALDPEDAFCG